MAISTYLATSILKASGLNAPMQRHPVAEWITRQDPYIHHLQGHTSVQKTHRDWKKSKTKKPG